MRHRLQDITAADRADADIVVIGHSHKPLVQTVDGVVEVNPGSAGPRRFALPITMAEMVVDHGRPAITIHRLVE